MLCIGLKKGKILGTYINGSLKGKKLMLKIKQFDPTQFLYHYRFTPGRTIDGDTFVATSIDLGFGTFLHNQTIRLLRVDAFEKRRSSRATKKYRNLGIYREDYDEVGVRAANFTRDILNSGRDMILETSIEKIRGNFGRILGEVWYLGSGGLWRNLNDGLVKEGLAYEIG